MSTDRERHSEYESDNDQERDDQIDGVDAEEEEEEPEEPEFELPTCPRCGWHNTRPSYSSNVVDVIARVFGFYPYRCRSCGNRFRRIRRIRSV